ncbi:MAG: CDP-alcohol phosphatidyltransferase family protein [Lachnospiraceae bacterium]|nr:CDP-alcohol phosphatidyltransferase family protein [Lachnospiraceae bacterium]
MGEQKDYSKKVWTIPNILTMVRILLIPVFLWINLGLHNPPLSAVVLALSFFTDFLDGFIARKFHMVSDLGKALDPIADKLNQASILFALCYKYWFFLIPLGLMVVKETYLGILMLQVIRRTHHVNQAEWYGKVTTFVLYFTMGFHLIWPGRVPGIYSWISMSITLFFMVLSLVLYAIRNTRLARQDKDQIEQNP